MKTMEATKTNQSITSTKVNLIDGSFTVNEASEILQGLLNQKINFHKLQRLGKTEKNNEANCKFENSRIEELLQEKEALKAFFNTVGQSGAKLTINSTIEVQVEN